MHPTTQAEDLYALALRLNALVDAIHMGVMECEAIHQASNPSSHVLELICMARDETRVLAERVST